jgi:hypothetical protein
VPPDLAPSDFSPFGHIKQLLAGHEFLDRSVLLDAVQDIVTGTEKGSLNRVFLAWAERLEQYIIINGDYVG